MVIDISSKLSNEKPRIKIAEGTEYEVNNSKNTMLLISQELNNIDKNETKAMDKAVELALGKEAFKEIESMELSFNDYKTLFIAVMAGVSGQTYEEVESNMKNPRE